MRQQINTNNSRVLCPHNTKTLQRENTLFYSDLWCCKDTTPYGGHR